MKSVFIFSCTFLIFGPKVFAQETLWANGIGSNGQETCNSLSIDQGANTYAGGIFQLPFDADPGPGVQTLTSAGGDDLYFNKYNPDGSLQWARRIGNGSNDDWPRVKAIASGVYVSGSFLGTCDLDPGAPVSNAVSAGARDVWAARWSEDGQLVWWRKFGGGGNDYCYAMAVDEVGNLYLGGLFNGTADLDPGPGTATFTASGGNDVYVLKLDPDGNTLWVRTYGGSVSEGISAIEARNGQVYLVGTYYDSVDFDPGPGTFILSEPLITGDGYLVNWTSDGNFVWAHAIGESSADGASGVLRTDDGSLLVAGYFTGTVDFDPGPDVFQMTSQNGPSSANIYVVKYTLSGSFIWAKMWASTNFVSVSGIRRSAANGFWMCGSFNGTLDTDPGPGAATLVSTGSQSSYAAHFDPNGQFIWSGKIGGPSFVSCQAMDGSASAVMLSGQFAPSANFSVSGDPITLTTDGTSDAYIVRIGVPAPCPIVLETSATPVFCSPTGGTATVTVNPADTYTYLWNDAAAQSSTTATGLVEGTYQVEVSNGTCSVTTTVSVPFYDSCPSDFNADGFIGMADMTLFVSALGSSVCQYDLNQNGTVDFSDLSIFISAFGGMCP